MFERPDIQCASCGVVISHGTPYWRCPPLGSVCDKCWPDQSRGHLREFWNPKANEGKAIRVDVNKLRFNEDLDVLLHEMEAERTKYLAATAINRDVFLLLKMLLVFALGATALATTQIILCHRDHPGKSLLVCLRGQ